MIAGQSPCVQQVTLSSSSRRWLCELPEPSHIPAHSEHQPDSSAKSAFIAVYGAFRPPLSVHQVAGLSYTQHIVRSQT